jgi:predicted Zn finger-like uncharacterized protein
MVIQCPECGTKYNVPDDKARPEGTPVRCSKCKHVFKIFPEESVETEVSAGGAPEKSGEQSSPRAPESGEAQTRSYEPEQESREATPQDPGVRTEEEPAAAPGGKRTGFRVFLVLVLLLCAGAAAALYMYPDLPRRIMDMATGKPATPPVVRQADQQERSFEQIGLTSIKQYFVKNEKIGQLFVLEGKAVNRSDAPLREIVVRAALFDGAGKEVLSGRTGCGSTVSLFQLQVLDREGLDAALKPGQTPDAADGLIRPGAEAPFMIVFYDPPLEVREFGLEVVDVRK